MHERFTFRPLTPGDLPTLLRWFNAPHALPWYGGGCTLSEIEEEYLPVIAGDLNIPAYIACVDGREVGMVEHTRAGDFPTFQRAYRIDDPDTANIDVIVGEADVAHRGLGPAIIRAFLGAKVFHDPRTPSCVIDPLVDNHIAIRAYEKAGFTFDRALADDGEGNAVYLLSLTRADFLRGPAASTAPTVRPGRPGEFDAVCDVEDDATTLYTDHGLVIDVTRHPAFFDEERARWSRSFDAGQLLVTASEGSLVAFASLARLDDGAGWLQQLSVRRARMRQGLGRALLQRAKRGSVGAGALWITTWEGVAWNAPWYAREGFVRVPEAQCPSAIRESLALERRALPRPHDRVAMVYRHTDGIER